MEQKINMIEDDNLLKNYASEAKKAVEKYGGKFLVRGGKKITTEGKEFLRTAVIEFSSFDTAKKLIDDLPDSQTKSDLKGILDDLKEDQKTAQSFNARQHCAKVMNEVSGKGKAKLGELNYTLFQRIGGNSVINSELTGQKDFVATLIRGAKNIGVSN